MSAYHPDDMTLMNYAAGSLSIPQALAVSVHLCFCHECRDLVKNFNHLGGALLETIKPASTDDDAFDSLMASLEPHDHNDAPKVKVDMGNTDKITQHFSNPLLRYLPTSLAELPWQRQTKEISKFDLTALLNVKGFQVALQKINAGAKVPIHTHKGFEYTVILSGGFSDELGVYHEGDFIARDTSHKHSPTALQNEDCICLTVLNAPLKFTGWHRVLNPFMAWS
ncbi:ChrR family anti-sigma-E factor [Cellvibrio sp. PSBB023]|jgi:putative transcriptional regulator|uniref:ChrR family anti-sigma-E factor n=1 Tax=Cellvibrio sp. PSBB023 TaxID=1945512 RepID=UPI00098F02D8|nr:ChrR family anti-sigma-E factor [Cellvibrio sp. PSBB023]AQT60686.1 transcriptional regulator [Cellvibrio sp. PSBB023]